MVRVLVVGPLPPPVHGAARVTRRVADDLRARGVEVVEADSGDGGRSGVAGAAARAVRLLGALLSIVLRRVDTVYVGGAGGGLLWYQAAVVTAGRLARRRVVFHHHSFAYLDRPSSAMRAIVRGGGPRLVHVVLCGHMAAALEGGYGARDGVLVCSNAALVDPDGPSDVPGGGSEGGPDGGPLVLGHLSNLSVEKGLASVLETLRRAVAQGLDVSLRLAGPTSDEVAARLVAEARDELGPRLQYLGRLDQHQVAAFYPTIDVFLFPSRYVHEAEPLVVVDAARHGVPSLVHAVGCLPGMVVDPRHVVPREADFAAAAVPELERLGGGVARAEAARGARAWFEQRVGAAAGAHRDLVDLLTS